jgi:hypothetical protein
MKKLVLFIALLSAFSLNAQTGFQGKESDTKSKVLDKKKNYNQNYMVKNSEAVYKFGEDSLYKHIYTKLYATPEFLANTNDGHVLISFEVNFDTKVINSAIIEGMGNDVDAAVKKIITDIKDFVPAQQNGIDYRSEIIMDIPIKAR